MAVAVVLLLAVDSVATALPPWLPDCRRANFIGADLGGLLMAGVDLRGALLGDADLHSADLAGADLRGARMPGADLSHGDLRGAVFADADVNRAHLAGADVGGAGLLRRRPLRNRLRRRSGVRSDRPSARMFGRPRETSVLSELTWTRLLRPSGNRAVQEAPAKGGGLTVQIQWGYKEVS